MYAPGSACIQLYVCCRSGAILQVVWDILAGVQSRPGGQWGNKPLGAVTSLLLNLLQHLARSGEVRVSSLWGSERSSWRKSKQIWGCHSSLPVLAHVPQEGYWQVGMLGSCPSEVLGCCIHIEDFLMGFVPSSTSQAVVACSASSFSVGEWLAWGLNLILRFLQT